MEFSLALQTSSWRGLVRRKITLRQLAVVTWLLRHPTRVLPDGTKVNVLEQAESAVFAKAAAMGVIPVGASLDAFDWQAILDWILANLPTIIQIIMSLIALFAEDTPGTDEGGMVMFSGTRWESLGEGELLDYLEATVMAA